MCSAGFAISPPRYVSMKVEQGTPSRTRNERRASAGKRVGA
jgi:hypothetical protein